MFRSKKHIESDAHLASKIKKGDETAFRKLFDRYHLKVYNLSRKMGLLQEDAEGIVQEVFVTIWNDRLKLDPDLSINALLMTVSSRLVIKLFKRNMRWKKFEEHLYQNQQKYQDTTEDYIIFNDLYDHALQEIDQLPESRKQIFMLSKQLGLTNEEIATKLNISKRTVENQLYRATKSMESFIKKENLK